MTNHVSVPINRDATDQQVMAAYRKVVLKTHQDKGGRVADMQKLQDAPGGKSTWTWACLNQAGPGSRLIFAGGRAGRRGAGGEAGSGLRRCLGRGAPVKIKVE